MCGTSFPLGKSVMLLQTEFFTPTPAVQKSITNSKFIFPILSIHDIITNQLIYQISAMPNPIINSTFISQILTIKIFFITPINTGYSRWMWNMDEWGWIKEVVCKMEGCDIRFGYSIWIFKFMLTYANLCKLYANCSLCMQICKNVVLVRLVRKLHTPAKWGF